MIRNKFCITKAPHPAAQKIGILIKINSQILMFNKFSTHRLAEIFNLRHIKLILANYLSVY